MMTWREIERLASAVLMQWIVDDEPMEGEAWEEWCGAAGVDPDAFALNAKYITRDRAAFDKSRRTGNARRIPSVAHE